MNGFQIIQKILEERNWKSSITIQDYKNNHTRFEVECYNNHIWETSLRNLKRTKNCFKCWNDERTINDNTTNNVINEKYKLTIQKGDNQEIFITDIFIKNNIIAERTVIGNNTFDIIISINDIQRGIQVKELRKSTRHKNGFIT